MRKYARNTLALLLCLAMALSLAACGDQKAPAPEETAAPKLVYQAEFTDLGSVSENSLNPVAFTNDGLYATTYMKIGENIPEGAVVEYEGQYDVYGARLFFVSNDGKVEQLSAYEPLAAAENTEERPNFGSSTELAGVLLNPDGTLTAVEEVYTNWFEGDEEDMYSEESWQYWHYESQYYIRKLNADGSEISSAPIDFDATESYLGIYNANLDDAGNLLASSDFGLVAIAPDGSIAYTIESEDYIEGIVRLKDGRTAVTTWGNNGMSCRLLDSETGELAAESLSLPHNAYNLINGGGDYDLYYQNGSNLYGVNLETGESEKVLNWISCDVNGDSLNRIFVADDGTVRSMATDWSDENVRSELVTVRLVPADSVPQKETLTLGAMYLDYQMTNKIIQFNRKSEKCRIEVLDYSEYNTEDDYTAGLTKLTTEIMAGNLPDLLSLRQLPYRQLAAKGLLEDLYPYLDADENLSREDLFPTVLSAMEVDGKLYQVTPSFSIMTLVGASSVVGDTPGWTYDEFDAALASMPEGCDPLDYYTTRDDILQTLVYLDMDDFVDWTTGKCSFDSSEFIDLLNFANRFPAKFDWENYEWTESDSTITRIAEGRQMLMQNSIYSLDDVTYNDLYFGGSSTYIGFPSNNGVGNMLYLNDGYAMSSTCKDKAAAWEFLRTVLGEDYQRSMWGLPVNIAVFNKKLEEAMTPEYQKDADGNYLLDENGERIQVSRGGIGFADGTTYDIYAITQEQADKLMELINTTTRSYEVNSSIFDIVQEQAQAFFAGQKSAEEVARLVQSKANIYVNEQR